MNKTLRWPKELRDNRNEMQYAKREMKKGDLSQLLDMVKLRSGRGKLGISEYYFLLEEGLPRLFRAV